MKQMLLHCAHEGADWETWLLHGKRLDVTTAMSLHCLLCSARAPQKWALDIWAVREEEQNSVGRVQGGYLRRLRLYR